MYYKLFSRAATYSCYSLSGLSLYYLANNEKFKLVHSSWTTDIQPSTKWDANWDHRAPTSLIKPLDEGSSPEKHFRNKQKEKSAAVRHIILVRHGQYYLQGKTDSDRVLSELGRKQAKMTGQRLKELKIPINTFIMSTMKRAQETGNLILEQFDGLDKIKIEYDPLIEEGAPIPPEPKVGHWKPSNYFFEDGSRIEAAFRKHFHRADPSQKEDSHTVLVCHANVIRYFVCRALQIPPEAWLRMSLHHASITWLAIHPHNGRVVLKLYGDCGHLPRECVSNANINSFAP